MNSALDNLKGIRSCDASGKRTACEFLLREGIDGFQKALEQFAALEQGMHGDALNETRSIMESLEPVLKPYRKKNDQDMYVTHYRALAPSYNEVFLAELKKYPKGYIGELMKEYANRYVSCVAAAAAIAEGIAQEGTDTSFVVRQ